MTQWKQERSKNSKGYGDTAITVIGISGVKNSFTKFQKGEFEIRDNARSVHHGRRGAAETVGHTVDATQSTRELARRPNMDHSTVLRRLKAMGKILTFGRCFPHALSE